MMKLKVKHDGNDLTLNCESFKYREQAVGDDYKSVLGLLHLYDIRGQCVGMLMGVTMFYILPDDTRVPGDSKLTWPIDMLELTVRTRNCLKAEEIHTVNDLVKWTSASLIKTPNFGRKSLKELEEVMRHHGLYFGMPTLEDK